MDFKSELENAARRFEKFADRPEQEFRQAAKPGEGPPKGAGIFDSVYWDLRNLFGQSATRDGLKDLDRDTRETFRFFTRHIDFKALQVLPPWKRYPIILWRAFLAMASRLSPPRRLAFAIGIVAFLLGWIPLAFDPGLVNRAVIFWVLVAFSFTFVLLLLELRDKLSLKGDLEVAREIQFGLVPSQPLVLPGLEVHAQMRPANTVGGDYYDVIDLGSGRVGFVVGDVAGKGMPAALLMALLQGSLRTLITAGLRGPELIAKLNEYLYANTPANKLVTLFFGDLDPSSGLMRYVNAGHNAPFLLRTDGTFGRLEATTTVLGIGPDCSFDAAETTLAPGDRLVLFTDGITEAFNPAEEEYGEQRLAQFLLANRARSHEDLIRSLIQEVLAFCGSNRPGDDMTILVVQRA